MHGYCHRHPPCVAADVRSGLVLLSVSMGIFCVIERVDMLS